MFYLKLVIVLLYELLLLIAIAFIVGFLFLIFFDSFENNFLKYVHQFLIWAAWGAYFVISWKKFGQTLPMRSWKLKINFENSTYKYLLLRYLKVSICWIFFPFNFLAVLVLKNKFLHDIKTQNQIIDVRNKPSNK
jgi:uncharacterized RDD family membrane protein YckC